MNNKTISCRFHGPDMKTYEIAEPVFTFWQPNESQTI